MLHVTTLQVGVLAVFGTNGLHTGGIKFIRIRRQSCRANCIVVNGSIGVCCDGITCTLYQVGFPHLVDLLLDNFQRAPCEGFGCAWNINVVKNGHIG